MKIYREFIIDDIEELVADGIEKINGGLESVAFIAKYDEAISIIKELLLYDEANICDIRILSEEFSNYNKEYLIELDEQFGIYCDEMVINEQNNEYTGFFANAVYIMSDCNSKCVLGLDAETVKVVIYADEADTECDTAANTTKYSAENTTISHNQDGTPDGFTKSQSGLTDSGIQYFSSYSCFTDDIELLREVAKKLGVEL